MESNLSQQLVALREEHADLNEAIDRLAAQQSVDQLRLRRMKKRRLKLKDQISRIQSLLIPDLDA